MDKTTTEQIWTDEFPQVEEGLYWVRHKENHADIDVARLRNGSLYPTDGGSMSKSRRRDWEYSGPIVPTTTEQSVELGLTWGENVNREEDKVHTEWHAPCGCAFHPKPFPHVHPCTNEHKRPDLHTLTEETERERVLRRRRAMMPDYDRKLEEWLS